MTNTLEQMRVLHMTAPEQYGCCTHVNSGALMMEHWYSLQSKS